MRIIVTGSRWYEDRALVEAEIRRAWLESDEPEGSQLVVIHGDATGADAIAAAVSPPNGWRPQLFEADWKRLGRAAGPERNGRMCAALPKADLCLAFPLKGSRGTWDCVRQAWEHGIPHRIIAPRCGG